LTYEEILLYHFPEFLEKHNNFIKNDQSIVEHILQGENAKTDPFDSEEDEYADEEEKIESHESKLWENEGNTAVLFMKEPKEEKEEENKNI